MALKDIIGQERPVRILSGTIKRDRVPSSILLSGDSGIGKMLAARSYAKALNCLAPVDFDACDKCSSCRKIDSESHPDITFVLPENDEIKIESVRQAEEVLSLKPYEGKVKVLIVDDADLMNINAANAFLKTRRAARRQPYHPYLFKPRQTAGYHSLTLHAYPLPPALGRGLQAGHFDQGRGQRHRRL
jgi:DNA polymerase-3 subunit delta'